MSSAIQSSNYVPGVSGWKFDQATGEFEIEGVVRMSAGRVLPNPEGKIQPFIVVDGVTYIRQSFIDDSTITKALIKQECSARMMADSVMSARVSALEAQISQLRLR
ncbi:hypothetical protein PFWH6_3922 [Pseudomonas fluorescens WH6]|nr:hypothetical protein PFWH6_3922 [Pseudomonas fluorescens WH6]